MSLFKLLSCGARYHSGKARAGMQSMGKVRRAS